MTPYRAYHLYNSVKQHFSRWDYDCFKYNFKTNASVKSFERRNDKYWFQKLAKHEAPAQLIVSNIVAGASSWVKDLLTDEAETIYKSWNKRQQSITYNFKNECSILEENFNDYFIVKQGQWPIFYKLYKQGAVSPETLLMVDSVVKFLSHWNSNIQDETIWPEDYIILEKYKSFIKFDENKVRKILQTSINS